MFLPVLLCLSFRLWEFLSMFCGSHTFAPFGSPVTGWINSPRFSYLHMDEVYVSQIATSSSQNSCSLISTTSLEVVRHVNKIIAWRLWSLLFWLCALVVGFGFEVPYRGPLWRFFQDLFATFLASEEQCALACGIIGVFTRDCSEAGPVWKTQEELPPSVWTGSYILNILECYSIHVLWISFPDIPSLLSPLPLMNGCLCFWEGHKAVVCLPCLKRIMAQRNRTEALCFLCLSSW